MSDLKGLWDILVGPVYFVKGPGKFWRVCFGGSSVGFRVVGL